MGQVIAIVNQQGGAGKTTTAVCLSEHLNDRGIRSDVVSFDAQHDTDLITVELCNIPDTGMSDHLMTLVEEKRQHNDILFLDCPSSLGTLTVNALMVADSIIIPIRCESKALEDLPRLLNILREIKRTDNKELTITGVLLTFVNPQLRLSAVIYNELRRSFDQLLLQTVIRENHTEDYNVLTSELIQRLHKQ